MKPVPKPKKEDARLWEKKADKAFSVGIRMRDGWKCVLCGETDRKVLECGHLIGRSFGITRFNDANAFCQCRSCNRYHEVNPHIFTYWYIRQFGVRQYEVLVGIHRQPAKYSVDGYKAIISRWECAVTTAKYRVDPEVRRLVDWRTRSERELRNIETKVKTLLERSARIEEQKKFPGGVVCSGGTERTRAGDEGTGTFTSHCTKPRVENQAAGGKAEALNR